MVELLNAPLRIVTAGQPLQVLTDELVEALAEDSGLLSGTGYDLLIDGQSYIHAHSICAQRLRGKLPFRVEKNDHFLTAVLKGPKQFVRGTERELDAINSK